MCLSLNMSFSAISSHFRVWLHRFIYVFHSFLVRLLYNRGMLLPCRTQWECDRVAVTQGEGDTVLRKNTPITRSNTYVDSRSTQYTSWLEIGQIYRLVLDRLNTQAGCRLAQQIILSDRLEIGLAHRLDVGWPNKLYSQIDSRSAQHIGWILAGPTNYTPRSAHRTS